MYVTVVKLTVLLTLTLVKHARYMPSAACVVPPEDEQVTLVINSQSIEYKVNRVGFTVLM
jgi:hypothetical protein